MAPGTEESPGSGQSPALPRQSTKDLLRAGVPAAAVGVVSVVLLVAATSLAGLLQELWWNWLPAQLGVPTGSPWWTIGVLTLTGAAVGATIQYVPGNAGNDPATTGLVAPPLPLRVVPSLALALVVTLAGGVSLGPENPIIAINVAVAVWLLARLAPGVPAAAASLLAVAGTIGAMFGSPVAAALLLTGMLGGVASVPLFDRLFAPLVAAGAGAVTMVMLEQPTFAVDVPGYAAPSGWDLLSGPAIAVVAALFALPAVYALPVLHRFFHRLPHAVLALGLAGLVLGVLGAAGGRLTMFRGLDEMQELAADAPDMTTTGLILITVVKLAALAVAAAAGFRGGRIFPAVFLGVGVGLVAHALVPGVPLVVAISAATLGTVLVADRDGWLALFMATVTVGDVRVLPLLCLILLPLWLVVRNQPELQARTRPGVREFGSGEPEREDRHHA